MDTLRIDKVTHLAFMKQLGLQGGHAVAQVLRLISEVVGVQAVEAFGAAARLSCEGHAILKRSRVPPLPGDNYQLIRCGGWVG